MQVCARPDGYTYYDDPKRKKPEEHRVERETAVYDFSMRYHEETRQFGPQEGGKLPKRYPWDRAQPYKGVQRLLEATGVTRGR